MKEVKHGEQLKPSIKTIGKSIFKDMITAGSRNVQIFNGHIVQS